MDTLGTFLLAVSNPTTLLMLVGGVVAGLFVGAMPGVGGLFAMALLLPLTNGLDIYAGMGLLIGLGSVVTTSDTLPAILIGVPGSAAAIATVEDGHPLARQGQAGRALGASYSASMLGGVFGAAVLALAVPVLRPLILTLRTPDFLAVSVLGLLFVAAVSGKAPLKGVLSALLGILFSMTGLDALSGAQRFTFGSVYFWDGLSISIVFVGLFGLAELAELLRRGVVAGAQTTVTSRVVDGIADTFREWRLVLQSSAIGTVLGALPGLGVTTIDWVVYGLARRHRGSGPEFGTGNIRGVIAPESANNAKEGGNLIPTLALGLPGSVSMAFILALLSSHGIAPGPRLMMDHLPLVYAIVAFIALANVLGTAICLGLTRPLAKLATAPAVYVVPVALAFVVLGAFREHLSLIDIAVLVVFGGLGFAMKTNGWSRPAFAIGFILGPNIERYFFLSTQLTGEEWLQRPTVLIVLAVGAVLCWRAARNWRFHVEHVRRSAVSAADRLMLAGLLVAGCAWLVAARNLQPAPALFPTVVAGVTCVLAIFYLVAGVRERFVSPVMGPLFGASAKIGLMIAVQVALLHLVGPALSASATTAGAIAATTRVRPLPLFLVTAGVGITTFLLFDVAQHVSWPRPLFGF